MATTQTASPQIHEFSSSSSANNQYSTQDILFRLKKRYLLELKSLYSDCNWLRNNLDIDGGRELQPNEIKLLQFVSLVDSVIQEIVSLKDEVEAHANRDLINLESKIVKTILPVKARLHERWLQQKNEDSTPSKGTSSLSHEAQPKAVKTVELISFANTPTPTAPISTAAAKPKASRARKDSKDSQDKTADLDVKKEAKSTSRRKKSGSSASLADMPTRQSFASSSQSSLTEAMAGLKTSGSKTKSDNASVKDLPYPLNTFTLPVVSPADNLTILRNSGALQNTYPQQQHHVDASPNSTYDKARTLSVGDNLNSKDITLPVGPLKFSQQVVVEPEVFHPLAIKNEDGSLTQFFNMESAEEPEVHENIFDNISDCGVDLYDEDVDQLVISTFPELQQGIAMDPVGGKRSFSHSFLSSMDGKQLSNNKPPGPYYSSAVDLDLKSNFAMGAVVNREDEYMSSRRRRRLNQIVPNPRKPRQAEYQCSLCSEPYELTVHDNPWWCVYKHECPHCKQTQIPRIDISLPTNAIEIDPNVVALYGEGVEDSGDDGASYSDEYSEDEEGGEEDIAIEDGGNEQSLEESKSSEVEDVIFDSEGLLAKEEASKLLVLMCHARTCDGNHASDKHAEICKSTKFLMLHIRDCKGTDIHGRECSFPWCYPCKKMLKHLTQCYDPDNCSICNPWGLPESFQQLRKLNQMQYCQLSSSSSSSPSSSPVEIVEATTT